MPLTPITQPPVLITSTYSTVLPLCSPMAKEGKTEIDGEGDGGGDGGRGEDEWREKSMEKTKRGYEEKTEKETHSTEKKSRGGYREGELPVAIATAGTLVQSPRQCLVARERFRRRERGARRAAALFPDDFSADLG